MMKKLFFLIYKFLSIIDFICRKIFKKSILIFFKDFIEKDSYTKLNILNQKALFFTPNDITKWRVKTFFSKEPETLEWIDAFDNKEKITYWDIGSNIGLYSIYAALRFKNIQIISFEPSTSNLRILSRNISINDMQNKINICQLPLTNASTKFLEMKESKFIEGWSMNSFGENLDFSGKPFISKNKYKILGTNIDFLIEKKILETPNYIKIDVDGIEHLILDGGKHLLQKKELRGLSIELNENFQEQYSKVLKIMKDFDFKLKHKKHAEDFYKNDMFAKTFNYIFERN